MSSTKTRTPDVKSSGCTEKHLHKRHRQERTAKLDKFFAHKRASIFDMYKRGASTATERVLAIRTPNRKIRIRVSDKLMTSVFPSWPAMVEQRKSGLPRAIKNVSLEEPEAEFALKLLVRAAHGESDVIKGLETATAKQLFYPNGATQFTQPVNLRDAVDAGIENLFWEAGGLNYIDGWPLLGIVANRFRLEEFAWFLSNPMVFSFNKDGNIVIDEPIESLTQEQLVAVTNTWPEIGDATELAQYREGKIDKLFASVQSFVDRIERFEVGIIRYCPSEGSRVQACPNCVWPDLVELTDALIGQGLWPLSGASYE